MNLNRKEIIVNGTIDNDQKQIILSKEPFTTGIYNIMIDKEYHGQVIKNISGWDVYPHEKSWLNGKNCDVVRQAVLNVENPNSLTLDHVV